MNKNRKVIVGLGNPGRDYAMSRHNLGFMFLDRLVGGGKFSVVGKLEAEIVEINGLLCVKPQTFMNDSGRSVRKVMDYYKFTTDDLVVIHDDLDIKLGEYKLQKGIGPKVHNGVTSIETSLGSRDFLRLRLGIDNREAGRFSGSGADYVLANFGKEESEAVDEMLDESLDELLVALGLEVE